MFNTIEVRYDGNDITGRKYEHFDPEMFDKTSSKLQINLDELYSIEIINYSSNMINEYSMGIIIERATVLSEINLTNIQSFLKPELSNKILMTIFGNEKLQKNLKKLILL